MKATRFERVHRSGVACARPSRALVPPAALARAPQPDGHPHRAAGPQPLRPRPAARRRRPLPPPAAPGGRSAATSPRGRCPRAPRRSCSARAPAEISERLLARTQRRSSPGLPQPARRLVAPVHGPRLAEPRPRDAPARRSGSRSSRRRPLGRSQRPAATCSCAAARRARRPDGAPRRPGLRQHRVALVGRVPALREHPGPAGQAARGRGRAPRRWAPTACCRSTGARAWT